jgi:hypothetical protein
MKSGLMFLIGLGLGVIAALNLFPGKDGPVVSGSATLQVKTAGDTVVVNSKNYDTVVVNVGKDTVVVNSIDSKYCKQIPRPSDCPPVISKKVRAK